MHDGSLSTLDDVIDLYNRGGIDRPSRDDDIHRLNLPQSEKADWSLSCGRSMARQAVSVPRCPERLPRSISDAAR